MTTPVLHHRVEGPDTAPPLVLGPSLGTSLSLWEAHVPALARHFRVIRWDFPGHGGTPADVLPELTPGATTVADLGRLVLELADRLRIEAFDYAGVSLAGAVGAWLAVHHPGRIRSLAMVCSSARFGEPSAWQERAALVRHKGTGPVADTAASRWFTPAFAADPVAEAIIEGMRGTDPDAYAACCDAIAGYDLRAELPRITAPTLIVAGRDDPATPPAHARELADSIPDAALTEIPRAAHLAIAERPAPVLTALLSHLAQPAPDRRPSDDGSRHAAGMTVRRAVLGDAHVDRAIARTSHFTAPFQDFITRYAWGEIWTRPGLSRRTRSGITLTALVAHGHLDELAMHVRAALNNGLTPEEIQEVLLQSAIYCGVPAANAAFAVADRVLGAYHDNDEENDAENGEEQHVDEGARRRMTHTTVGIIGGGPAGLMLARLLQSRGVDCVVLESRDRAYVENRQRAGILEQGTIDVLRACGAGERMDREGLVHDGIELRFDRRAHRVDFPALTAGRRVMVYAQTEVVKDLIRLQLDGEAPLFFEAQVHSVTGADTDRPTVHFTHEGRTQTLTCDYVVGCDGFHGVTRDAFPLTVRSTYERTYPYSWLGILAEVPPSCNELIYAHSPRGFALHSMRSTRVSRLYLQVPNGTDVAQWSDQRIWDELDERFAVDGDWKLARGPITAKSVLPMRSHVTEPMRYGRVFLAGDAAHIVPPTGAKGLNLAVADVVVLARALAHWHATGSGELLDAYSDTCLRRVWRAEHFSYFMTSMLHTDPQQSPFETRLQLSQLERITTSRTAAAELAENYTGLPLADPTLTVPFG